MQLVQSIIPVEMLIGHLCNKIFGGLIATFQANFLPILVLVPSFCGLRGLFVLVERGGVHMLISWSGMFFLISTCMEICMGWMDEINFMDFK